MQGHRESCLAFPPRALKVRVCACTTTRLLLRIVAVVLLCLLLPVMVQCKSCGDITLYPRKLPRSKEAKKWYRASILERF